MSVPDTVCSISWWAFERALGVIILQRKSGQVHDGLVSERN